ncbi:mucin-4 isoform X2 [Armigeres subalbatus]|uniref:mucin-4 isoform X2 n=1 Tax=Armigeres subalbatus TaxID=124917 RepID=UPI002ED32915
MSSSVFKVYPSSPTSVQEAEEDGVLSGPERVASGDDPTNRDTEALQPASVDEHLKIDSNLVIVVGKDGSVHVDQKTLHSLLAQETNDTSVSVVQITSPTPSIEAEIEDERKLLEEQKLQNELESGTGSSDSDSVDSAEPSNAASTAGASKNEPNPTGAGSSGVTTRRGNRSAAAKKEDVMLDDGEIPHVSMVVEGFYPPSEARTFAEEVLTLAGLRKPLHVETRIDYEFQRYVVANDHCYTPLTSPSQKLPPRPYYEDLDSPVEVRPSDDTLSTDAQNVQQPVEGTSGTSRKRTTSKVFASTSTSTSKSRRKKSFSKEEINDAEDLKNILEDSSDSDYSAESSYPEEDDNDSDYDYNITGRTPKKRKSISQSKPKSASKRDDSLELAKKKTKSPKKFEPKTPTSMLNKAGGVPRTYGSKRNLQNVQVSTPPQTPPIIVPAISSPAAVSAPAPVTVTIIKKDHKKPVKPAPHVEALFSDMSSLFSTPDIIKKVGPGAGRATSHVITATTTPVITPSTSNTIRVITQGPSNMVRVVTPSTSNTIRVVPPSLPNTVRVVTSNPSNTVRVVSSNANPSNTVRVVTSNPSNTIRVVAPSASNTIRGFVQLSPATVRGTQKLPAHISIQTHTSASEEHDKRFDLIDSIVQQELNHPDPKLPPQPPSQPTMTEDIVKMLENNLPPGGVQESVLPITDNSILAALGSNDDGLPEDLLQHVAELAEHKELQEILDKQILGVIGTDTPIASIAPLPTPSTSTMIPIPVSQQAPTPNTPQSIPPSTANPESLPTMTVKEQLMPRKEAIQIRRSDGRIITLPPIEAPATRSAKRRAQAGSSSSPSSTPVATSSHTATAPSVASSPSSSAYHSTKPSKQSTKATAGATSYDDGSGSLMIDESRSKGGNRSGTSSRRTSESSNTSGRGKRQSTASAAAAVVAAAVDDDAESDKSWNSEDDPDRLWCICKQPHNNRFMICCDTCEEWFHGKCVNITKAMGQQMEEDGVEWSCPNCSKKKQEKQQPKMTDFLVSSSSATSISTAVAAGTATANPPKVVAVSISGCVVCSNVSKPNSVYCSDECIRKHAGMANSSVATTTPLSSTASSPSQGTAGGMMAKEKQKAPETGQSKAPLVISKSQHLIVMERKTGRCLAGSSAPKLENLKEWLSENPTFEVVAPGSPQAAIILARQAELRKMQLAKEAQRKTAAQSMSAGHSSGGKIQAQLKITDQRKLSLTSASPSQPKPQAQLSSKPPVKTFSRVLSGTPASKAHSATSITKSAATTPKTPGSSTPSSSGSEQSSRLPRKSPSEPKVTTKQTAAPAGENIRETVKKTLKEHLIQRSTEITEKNVARLAESEIEKFAAEIEEEMFALFNKDTGAKYRAKYRSLVFNIKDRKNLSLFQKICEKRIEAKQLVRMTPEELASQELAQWRENENKHQLEMIKKSELDLLACAKNYVLKTHKGEEVIEGKRNDRLQLDPTTAVEDVVAVLNNSTVSSTSEVDSTLSPSVDNYRKDYDFHGKYTSGLYSSGPITSSTASGSSSTATGSAPAGSSSAPSSVKKKESRRSRSRSRSRDRNKERSRSRSKHKRRRSRSHERRSRSRERDRDRHHRDHKADYQRSDSKTEHKSVHHKSEHKKHDSREKSVSDKLKEEASSSIPFDRSEALGKSVEVDRQLKKPENKPQAVESFNLIDKILSSGSSGKPSEVVDKSSKSDTDEPNLVLPVEQDQEPTSTVTIPTPPHSTSFDNESPTNEFSSPESDDNRKMALKVYWTGNVHMIDVASVQMSIRSVSGDIEDISKEFPEDLEICGTIKPELVWNYIGQIKRQNNKEICLVRFHSNESAAYYELYTRLFKRERCGVLKSLTPAIKDFYICPLPSEKMIPMILKPLRGVGIIEGDKKPDLLLGIIVKIKATSSTSTVTQAPRRQTKATASSSSTAVSPSFALMQQVITKYATVNKKVLKPESETVSSSPSGSPGSPPPSTSSSSLASASTKPESKTRTLSESSDHGEIDMNIIKAPIVAKAPAKEPIAAVVIDDDDDEPYSPGGVSDDSDHFADVTAIVETKAPPTLDFETELDELNRKIAEEKSEIVGIINKAELKEEEIKSTLDPSLITDIAIPSNLSEILASIKSTSAVDMLKVGSEKDTDDEYVPSAVYSGYKSGYGYGTGKSRTGISESTNPSTSRLAKLTEEELLRMVPDDSYLQPTSAKKSTSSVVNLTSDDSVPLAKKPKWESSEPPPPGLEGVTDE